VGKQQRRIDKRIERERDTRWPGIINLAEGGE